MFLKKIQLFSMVFICLYQFSLAWAKEESAKAQNEKNSGNQKSPDVYDENGKKKIPPLPRHVLLPEITYARLPDIEGEYKLDFSAHKFWFIAVLASWNERSSDITKILNSHMSELEERGIGVFALFSQNSEKDVEKWRLKNKPLFRNFFATRNFIDSLKNPKIPTIWLVGSKGEIILKSELPTIQQIDGAMEKTFILTGF